jgi:hypothetical protein
MVASRSCNSVGVAHVLSRSVTVTLVYHLRIALSHIYDYYSVT